MKVGEIWWEKDSYIKKMDNDLKNNPIDPIQEFPDGVSEYGYGDNFTTKAWSCVQITKIEGEDI